MENDSGQADYQNPQVDPSTKKRGNSPALKWGIGCCGGFLIVVGVGIFTFTSWLKSPEGFDYLSFVPQDRQIHGEKLAWRTLVELPDRLGFMGRIEVGNFDNDPEPDILFVSCPAKFYAIDLDGKMELLAEADFDMAYWIKVWDWDADGIDEIVFDSVTGNHQDVDVYGMDGQLKHRFKNHRMGAYSITGDYDGDGNTDLMLIDPNGPGAWIYGVNGQLLEKLDCIKRSNALMLTDIDNDGLADGVVYEYENFKVYSFGKEPRTVNWSIVNYDEMPYWADDINDDAIVELINPIKGILDITAGVIPLSYDVVPDLDFLDAPGTISCNVFREKPDGLASLVVTPGNFNAGPIYIFDVDGKMTYHQKLNPEPTGCTVINSEGQDYLIVSTQDKIMIYP